ncbi:hypothetical protein F5880DRAFT_1511492 [Lentinula raphanica]|nr:hypothetical protein F5880DRAFT_1511492 [Lentinula raphanica]
MAVNMANTIRDTLKEYKLEEKKASFAFQPANIIRKNTLGPESLETPPKSLGFSGFPEILKDFQRFSKQLRFFLMMAMVDELSSLLSNFLGKNSHVRCFAHTLNLTAKGILRPFEFTKGQGVSNNAGDNDMEREELISELHNLEEEGDRGRDNLKGFVNALDEMDAEERATWQNDVAPLKSALFKWREQVEGMEFDGRVLPRDVATRLLEMKQHISDFVDHSSYSLSAYVLDDDEWKAIGDLVSVLKILKDATTFFSANSPSIAAVIPTMDTINQVFATGILDHEVLSAPS